MAGNDVTGRTDAEKALRESEARLQAILDHTPAAVYLKDLEGRLLLANRGMEAIFGRPADWFPGKDEYALFATRELAEAVRANDRAVIAAGVPISFEEIVLQDDGPHTFLSTKFPLRDETGRIVAVGGVSTDITERKRVEADRERAVAELEAIIASIPDAVIIYDLGGRILRANPAAERMLGYTPEMRRQSLPERAAWMRPETTDGQPLPVEEWPVVRALRGETVFGAVLILHPAPNRALWVSISAAPIRTPGGEPRGAVATATDITRLRELQKDQEVYTHTISHDLRTPLTVIHGHAELLKEMAKKGEEMLLVHAEAILQGAERMNAMIEDLVEAARLGGGQLKLEKTAVDLGIFITDLLQRSAAGIATERISFGAPADLPPVSADPNRLERVVMNLLTNALKYSPPESPVELQAWREGDRILLTVTDHGVGIAPEDLPHIFERFYRPRGGRKGGGVGLGLYIARMLVEAHGGTIRADCTPGEGCTFTLTLPYVHPG